MSKDQRASERIPLQLKVDWKSEGTFLFENATNISEQGIFIETEELMNPGTILDLQFTLPESEAKISAQGEVMWVNKQVVEGNSPGMGVRFVQLTDIDRETILTLVKRIAVLDHSS